MRERVHFIGIGGIGMSALAQILLARGDVVSGSDAHASGLTAQLANLGAAVAIGHRKDLVEGADRVVVSDAIQADNPELTEARARGLRVQRRSQLLAELMSERRAIAVSGTHGKTTVTAMIGAILTEAGMDPTLALGGTYGPLGGNARVGQGEWFVAEACEAYDSFLDLRPEIALVTNIEADHLDHHKTEGHLRNSFRQFLSSVEPGGRAVLCADRPELMAMAAELGRPVVTYGESEAADFRGSEMASTERGGCCRIWVGGERAGELRVASPGRHNVVNALGATAAAVQAGAPLSACQAALATFHGVDRRFQVLGEAGGATIVDDYAHHPTEVAATIAAARAAFPERRVVAVFQPHLYSRTRDFAEGFARALGAADVVVLTDIYPAREAPLPGVTSRLIADRVRELRGKDAVLEAAKEELTRELSARVRPGDVVLVMGAGDVGVVAHELAHTSCAKGTAEQEVVPKR